MIQCCLTSWFRAAAALACALAVTACTTPPEREARRQEVEEAAYERTQQNRLRIPPEPVDLSADYGHPEYTIRQHFLWGPYESEWRLTLVDFAARYAGFRMKRPLPIPDQRDGMALYFELWPSDVAPTLALGLNDDPQMPKRDIPVLPLEPYRIFLRNRPDLAIFAVPLSDLEEETIALQPDQQWQRSPADLDWDAIRGVHLVRLDPTNRHTRRIVLRNLQVAPWLWIREMQVEDPR